MSKFIGQYEVTQKLGSGSYAQVFKCIDTHTGEPYAIKAISKDKLGDPKLQENLNSEITIMRDYRHPNIVRLVEHFNSSRSIYLVLELCPGGDLAKYIKKVGLVDESVSHNFLRQLTAGLAFLQQRNLIHRDIKPANILLSEASENAVLKLADFGFAKHLAEASMAQTPCGSPLYMAPEIFEMQEYDAKADLWSVGCVFYEMLVGSPPFRGSNPRELFQNIKTKSLTVPADVAVGSESLLLLRKLLERNPLRRISLDQLSEACNKLQQVTTGNQSLAGTGATQIQIQVDTGTVPINAACLSQQQISLSVTNRPTNPATTTTMVSLGTAAASTATATIAAAASISGGAAGGGYLRTHSSGNESSVNTHNIDRLSDSNSIHTRVVPRSITKDAAASIVKSVHIIDQQSQFCPETNNDDYVLKLGAKDDSRGGLPVVSSANDIIRQPASSLPLPTPSSSKDQLARAIGNDDDFVIVDQCHVAALHPWRAQRFVVPPNRAGSSKGEHATMVDDSEVSKRGSSEQTSAGAGDNSSDDSSAVHFPMGQQHQQSQGQGQEEYENEWILVTNILQRCERVANIVTSIVFVGDGMAREGLLQEKRAGSANILKRLRADSIDGCLGTFSGASALYLHALELAKDALKRNLTLNICDSYWQSSPGSIHRGQMSNLNKELTALFDQLYFRVEHCHKKLSCQAVRTSATKPLQSEDCTINENMPQSYTNVKTSSNVAISQGRITAEPLMYRAAIDIAREASVEELLGNLQKACDLYEVARLLVEGVVITASDPNDRRNLQHYAATFTENHAKCQQLHNSHARFANSTTPSFN